MSKEDITTELGTNGKNTIVSRKIVTKQNEEVVTRRVISSRTSTNNSIIGDMQINIPESNSLSEVTNDGMQRTVQRTEVTKKYTRRIIRKTGTDGVVTEEIIEEGDPIGKQMFLAPQQSFQSEDGSMPIKSLSCEDVNKVKLSGGSNFHATASFNCVSDTGESQTANFSTGPIQTDFLSFPRNMITDKEDDTRSQSMRLGTLNNFQNSSQNNATLGPTITARFMSTKKATVTESLTINGETKTRSKSAYTCFAGESMVQAKNTMTDMEAMFNDITAQMQTEGFKVLNQFMLSSNTSLIDHLALAGGDSGSSIFAIEAPPLIDPSSPTSKYPNKSPKDKTCHDSEKEPQTIDTKLPKDDKKVEEKQMEEVRQKIIQIKEQKSSKGLYWSNMDEVRTSGILEKMKKEEIHLQESIFEIISSEASYNISLDILIDLFYKNALLDPNRDDAVIDSVQKHHLFSNILLVKGVSLQLLKDLENRWSEHKPKILDLADIILKHAEDSEFEQQYVNYLANQSYQIESLKSLLQKEAFKSALQTIQNDPKCCKLSLDSFLALPMQRLTRLKLLLDVVIKLMNQTKELLSSIPDNIIKNHQNALMKLKELLCKSENKKFEIDQKIRLIHLEKILEFQSGCKAVNIGSMVLIKEGQLKVYLPQLYPNALRKLSKKKQPSFYLIVLSDLVIIAKAKNDSKLLALDYCDRQFVEAKVICTAERTFLLKFPQRESGSLTDPVQFDTSSVECRDQWIQAITSQLNNERRN